MHTKKAMKTLSLIAGLAAAVTVIGSCENTNIVADSDAMLEYGRDYFGNPIMELNGLTVNRDETLAWYVADYSSLVRCEAASYRILPDGRYEFIRDEDAKKESEGIWTCRWHDGVAVHIENPDCTEIKVLNPKIATTINVTETPFSIYVLLYEGKTDMTFYNKDHKEIR